MKIKTIEKARKFKITLTEGEAEVVRAIMGRIGGIGHARNVASNIFDQLHVQQISYFTGELTLRSEYEGVKIK